MKQNFIVIRAASLSLRVQRRGILVTILLALLLCGAFFLSVTSGSYVLSAGEVWQAMQGQGDAIAQMIVQDNRLPRLVTAIGAGAAFGMSGAIFQSLMRNPLASPDIIGFGAGAGFGALIATSVFGAGAMVLPGAVLGGLIAAVLVFGLAWQAGQGLTPLRVVLVGIGISIVLSALADLYMSRLDILTASDLTKWLAGTLNTRSWDDVALIWIALIVLTPLAFWQGFHLARLEMSDDIAESLGVPVTRARLLAALTSVGLIAVAVSVAGPMPFVAFVAGPLARRLTGGAKPSLAGAAMFGAVVILLADLIARNAVGGLQMPAGVFTAIIGAPFLLWVLAAEFRKRAS